MTSRQLRRYEMLVRVLDFAEKNKEQFARSTVAREQLAIVTAAVKELSEHAVDTMKTAHDTGSPRALARALLLEQLGAVARTARALAATTPGLGDTFRLPDPRSDQAFITAGRLFAREAEAFKVQFIARAMPPTFIGDLTAAVDRFEQAIRERTVTKADRTVVKASIEEAFSSGAAALAQLDAIVTNQLRGDRVTMRVWQQARRVWAVRRARAGAEEPAAAPEAPRPPEATEVTS